MSCERFEVPSWCWDEFHHDLLFVWCQMSDLTLVLRAEIK
jgi:hypothetical protein